MIKKIGRVAGLQFDDNVASAIGSACADMPFWVRKACSYLHRRIDITERPIQVTLARLDPILSDFVRTDGATLAHVALRHLFRVYPELEPAVAAFYGGEPAKASKLSAAALQRYGIVSQFDANALSGDMIKLGYELHLSEKGSQAAEQTATPPSRSGIDELSDWADELAVIGRRRNVLERRLRALVLNFIRADFLRKRSGPSVSERIVATMPEKRRRQCLNISAESIVDKYFWKEMIDLICDKEWELFSQLFVDKVQFRNHCTIINDRPDAHAKDVDAADLALYRRSLKSVEDMLNKMG